MYPTNNNAASARMASRLGRTGAPNMGPFPPQRGINFGTPGGIPPEIRRRGSSTAGYMSFGGGGYGGFGWGETPGDMLNYAKSVDTFVDGLSQNVLGTESIDAQTDADFLNWSQSWKNYYGSLTGLFGWLKRSRYGESEVLQDWRKQAEAWGAKLSGLGAAVPSSAQLPPDVAPPPDLSMLPGLIKTIVIGGAVIVGGFVLLKAFDFFPKPARALSGASGVTKGYGRRRRGSSSFSQFFSNEGKTLLYVGVIGVGLYILYRGRKDV